jgi:xanthine dehydrogenase accessory factor
MGELYSALTGAIRNETPVAVLTEVQGPNPGAKMLVFEDSVEGSLKDSSLDNAASKEARFMLERGATAVRHWGPQGEEASEEVEVFIQSFATAPEMFVFGAVNLAAAVVNIGKFLGYRVTLCDARRVFATKERFPEADEIVVQWPDEFLKERGANRRTAICILTHDVKFDIPLLQIALQTPAAYIGAMGSRRTHAKRQQALKEEGVTEEAIERIQAPLGLDIGAASPEEVAVAIAGQIIALKNGRSGGFLKDASGRIHANRDEPKVPGEPKAPGEAGGGGDQKGESGQ